MEGTQIRPAFDRDVMLERLGGDEELLHDVLEVFLEESSNMMNEVRRAVAGGDPPDLQMAAHTIKGALLNISADPAGEVALELEKRGREGPMAGVDALLSDLEREITRLEQQLILPDSASA